MVNPIAIAAIGSSLLSGLFGASKKAKAAKQAAQAQLQAQRESLAFQQRQYDEQRGLAAPWMAAGGEALGRQRDMLGLGDDPNFDPSAFLRSTPGYQFRLGEGQGALERSQAARGRFFSGETGQRLVEHGQDYASNEWGNLFNQYSDLAGSGRAATGATMDAAGALGRGGAAAYTGMGDARASGYTGAGDAWGGFFENTVPGAAGALSKLRW